ncbi:MAG: single-stranded-DNA-specific exonuclease RecJ [Candidatus Saccharibacteria bacterium]|nr:single-stranded-DNA-specific exonuclease RecJ [Candidatus Saccharibacteria bacterium]
MTDLFKQLLRQRGLDESFLCPKYENLFNPLEIKGVEAAVRRIRKAKEGGEKIIIYGDYDADGITSSTLLNDALKSYGCKKVEIILPNRFIDGYGLNMPAVETIAKKNATLIVTVDCGSGSEDVIAELKRRGIDTIVTDHHEIPSVPKSAVAVVNPKQGDRDGVRMAGVGVAFTLARALNMDMNGGKCDGQEKWLLDLVVIGTICDSMELREENRILTYFGMKVLEKTRRPGIKELARVAGVDLQKLNTHAIGFQLGPRINAAGRMKSADLALDLMTSKSRSKALSLAEELDVLNGERRKAQEKAVGEIEVSDKDAVIVACGDWLEGILGIIAGRLVELYEKPAFALTKLADGRLKGSGRSFGDFSLAKALQSCSDGLLLAGGGHAGACGVSLEKENLEKFREEINGYYKSLNLRDQERFLRSKSDLKLPDLGGLTEELFAEISMLEPFGDGNAEPVFEFDGYVRSPRVLKDKHLSIMLRDESGREMKMMAFYAPEEWKGLENNTRARVQFTLTKNEWHGRVSIEGNILSLERLEEIC